MYRVGHRRTLQEHRIDAHDERSALIVLAGQMAADHIICYGQEATMVALDAFDPWFFADARNPFVGAYGCVARPTGLSAHKTARIDVFTPPKQRVKQRDFGSGRRLLVDREMLLIHRRPGFASIAWIQSHSRTIRADRGDPVSSVLRQVPAVVPRSELTFIDPAVAVAMLR